MALGCAHAAALIKTLSCQLNIATPPYEGPKESHMNVTLRLRALALLLNGTRTVPERLKRSPLLRMTSERVRVDCRIHMREFGEVERNAYLSPCRFDRLELPLGTLSVPLRERRP